MERLTYLDERGQYRPAIEQHVSYKFLLSSIDQDVLDRLAAYEDTGLMPEDVKAMYDTVAEVGAPLWKIKELWQADAEGRLVVLPCKKGDTVYYKGGINGKTIVSAKVEEVSTNGIEYICYVQSEYGVCFGLNQDEVYFTREEAEAALAAQKGEKE